MIGPEDAGMGNVWLYGSAVAALASSGAFAAEPPLAPTIYKARTLVREPPPWTGLHAGLNAGYGWATPLVKETGDTVTGGQQAVNAGAIPAFACRPSFRFRTFGFRCGLGANYQIGWFWKSKPTGHEVNLTDNQTVSTSVATFTQFATNAQQDLEFFGTARGRLRFTPVEPVLRCVIGGLAYAEVKLSGAITNPACFGFCGTDLDDQLPERFDRGRRAGIGVRVELVGQG